MEESVKARELKIGEVYLVCAKYYADISPAIYFGQSNADWERVNNLRGKWFTTARYEINLVITQEQIMDVYPHVRKFLLENADWIEAMKIKYTKQNEKRKRKYESIRHSSR